MVDSLPKRPRKKHTKKQKQQRIILKTKRKVNEILENELNVLDTIINEELYLHNDDYDEIVKNLTSETKNKNNNKNTIDNPKRRRPTSVTLANIRNGLRKGIAYKNLRVLFDSGASGSFIDEGYCLNKEKSHKNFSTANGAYQTKYESEVFFTLPEFSDSKIVKWNFAVAKSEDIGYDMVIGRDLMESLGIDILFSKKVVTWEGNELPMRDFNNNRKMKFSAHEMNKIMQ